MANRYVPMDLKPHSILRLWGEYDIPVYETSVISSIEDCANLKKSSDTIFFGDIGEDAPIDCVQGIYRTIFPVVLDNYLDTTLGTTVIDEGSFYYNGKEGNYRCVRMARSTSDGISHGCGYNYYLNNNNNLNVITSNAEVIPTKSGVHNYGYIGSSGNAQLFVTFLEGNIRYYVRLCLSISIIADDIEGYVSAYPACITNVNANPNNSTQMVEFFGTNYLIPTTLDNITAGTVEELPVIIGPTNPYEPINPSAPGNSPPGTFDDTSDPISDSSLPTLSAANTGFTRIYNPTLSQVQALAKYLWTDDTVIETIWNHIKQYFEDPMQAIIGFNLVPVPVPDGGTESFALMYIDTGVEMTVAASQFVDVDCGTLAVDRYYGSALDQSPYTQITCFLPYIGQVQLDTDEVMGTTLQIKYRVDIVTGSCVAKILVDGNVYYQYSGHCAINIPISSADFSTYVSSAISVAKLAGTAAIASSGIVQPPPPVVTTQKTSSTQTTSSKDTSRNPNTGRQVTDSSHVVTIDTQDERETVTTKASFDGLSPQNISNTLSQVATSKPIIEHSGSFSGNSGYLGIRRPYLIIKRPNICLPANYQQLNGYPSMITMELGTCKGYTQVQQVQLTGIRGTNPELDEIQSLLKGGVIF